VFHVLLGSFMKKQLEIQGGLQAEADQPAEALDASSSGWN